jgi:hypothetical protein
MRDRARSSRREGAQAPCGERHAPPHDARGTVVGQVESVHSELSFGHLEPTVLLQRTGTPAPSSPNAAPAPTDSPPTADREDGNG